MKNKMITIVMLGVIYTICNSAMLFAGSWDNAKSYQEYLFQKSIANEAESEGNYLFASENYLLASEKALKCTNANVYGWQINNAVYSVIKQQQQCGENETCYQHLRDIVGVYKKLKGTKLTDTGLMQCLENNYKYIIERIGEQ